MKNPKLPKTTVPAFHAKCRCVFSVTVSTDALGVNTEKSQENDKSLWRITSVPEERLLKKQEMWDCCGSPGVICELVRCRR